MEMEEWIKIYSSISSVHFRFNKNLIENLIPKMKLR